MYGKNESIYFNGHFLYCFILKIVLQLLNYYLKANLM